MMNAGVNYSDWRQMAAFQRRDWLARRTVELNGIKKHLEEADSPSKLFGLIAARLLGMM